MGGDGKGVEIGVKDGKGRAGGDGEAMGRVGIGRV